MEARVYEDMAQAQSTHWWFVARREILRRQLQALRLPAGAEILEVGSGTGANLDLLAGFGRVVAFESSAEAIEHASRMAAGAQVEFLQGRCPEDLDHCTRRFDLICLFDVLEHIEEDGESLRRLAGLLKPGGRLVLTVPAYPWMWGPHDVAAHHKRRYTRTTLAAKCRAAGLSVLRMSHFNTLLFPLAVVERLGRKAAGAGASDLAPPPRPLNAVLARVFLLERHLLDRSSLPFGLSLLAVAAPSAQPKPAMLQ